MQSLASNTTSIHEPYERFPTNELRRECYRRKLTVIKSGPLCNATKSGFMTLLRESDTVTQNSGNCGGDFPNQQYALAAFESAMLSTAGAPAPSPSMSAAQATSSFLSPVDTVPAPHIISPPPSPTTAACQLPARPPRMDIPCDRRGSPSASKRGPSSASGKAVAAVTMVKKRKIQKQQRPQMATSQCAHSSQASTVSTSAQSLPPNDREATVPVTVKTETPAASASLAVTRWEQLFARLEAVNQKLQQLRGLRDPWCTTPCNEDASDVEFYTIMKQQLQRELLGCVANT